MRVRIFSCVGFTLVELCAVCALLAVLAGLALPSLRETLLNARRTQQVNALLRGLYFARNAAVSQALPVALCKSSDGMQCEPGLPDWSDGWIVFANKDVDSPAMVDAGETVLLRQEASRPVTVRANRAALTYWPASLAATTASFTVCDERGAAAARAVIVSATGRPRVSNRDSSGQVLECN